MNWELPDAQAGFRKDRGTRNQIVNICWIIEKAREFLKSIYICSIDYAKAFHCVDNTTQWWKLWKILKEMRIPDHLSCLLRNLYAGQGTIVSLNMEKWTGSKLGKEYLKAAYCHPAYLTYTQCTSYEMSDFMKNKLESRLPGRISITADIQMTSPLWQKVKRN